MYNLLIARNVQFIDCKTCVYIVNQKCYWIHTCPSIKIGYLKIVKTLSWLVVWSLLYECLSSSSHIILRCRDVQLASCVLIYTPVGYARGIPNKSTFASSLQIIHLLCLCSPDSMCVTARCAHNVSTPRNLLWRSLSSCLHLVQQYEKILRFWQIYMPP